MVHVAFQVWWLFQNSDKLQVSTPRGTIQTRPDRGKTSDGSWNAVAFCPVPIGLSSLCALPAAARRRRRRPRISVLHRESAGPLHTGSTSPIRVPGPVGRVGRRSPPAFPRLIRRSTTGSRSGSVKVYSIKPGRSRFGRSGSIAPPKVWRRTTVDGEAPHSRYSHRYQRSEGSRLRPWYRPP